MPINDGKNKLMINAQYRAKIAINEDFITFKLDINNYSKEDIKFIVLRLTNRFKSSKHEFNIRLWKDTYDCKIKKGEFKSQSLNLALNPKYIPTYEWKSKSSTSPYTKDKANLARTFECSLFNNQYFAEISLLTKQKDTFAWSTEIPLEVIEKRITKRIVVRSTLDFDVLDF